MNTGTLTVLFEDPFWIGLFEVTDHEGLHVCKVIFGAEPTEKEVMEFVDKNWHRLQFSQAMDVAPTTEIAISLIFLASLPVGRLFPGSGVSGIVRIWLTTASLFLLLMSQATMSSDSTGSPMAFRSLRWRTLSSWTQAYLFESISDMWSLFISFSILPVSVLIPRGTGECFRGWTHPLFRGIRPYSEEFRCATISSQSKRRTAAGV